MHLDHLIELLDDTPVIADIHPASLSYLPDNVSVSETIEDVVYQLDKPNLTIPRPYLITSFDPRFSNRFPRVTCEHNPFTPRLNEILYERFDDLSKRMLCQSDLAIGIEREANRAEVIVLSLVDGLSYKDVRDWEYLDEENWSCEPCLVDAPSFTRVAFPNVIGTPTIAERLFNRGFHDRIGFTYWHRDDNELTNRLFATIADVKKVGDFGQILVILDEKLQNLSDSKLFVQIIRTGLDSYAHSQKRRPPVEAISAQIAAEFGSLASLVMQKCSEHGLQANIYLTSDHGILWLHEFDPQIIGSAPAKASPRYSDWRNLYLQEETGRKFTVGEREYYCLGFPKLRRPARIDEQGVHGGISFQESVVPFIKVTNESLC